MRVVDAIRADRSPHQQRPSEPTCHPARTDPACQQGQPFTAALLPLRCPQKLTPPSSRHAQTATSRAGASQQLAPVPRPAAPPLPLPLPLPALLLPDRQPPPRARRSALQPHLRQCRSRPPDAADSAAARQPAPAPPARAPPPSRAAGARCRPAAALRTRVALWGQASSVRGMVRCADGPPSGLPLLLSCKQVRGRFPRACNMRTRTAPDPSLLCST